MLAFSEIIDFLLGLLRDPDARAAFEQDPQGTLQDAGLDGVTGQDVRDARLLMADDGSARASDDGSGSSYPGGRDAVQEINYTTQHYHADENVQVDDRGGFDLSFVDNSTTLVTIDDRDTILVQDSFNTDNSSTDVTVIDDSFNGSFNEDNDVVAIQDNDTITEDNDVTIGDVDIQDNDTITEDNDVVAIQDNDTVNEDNDVIDIQDNDTVVQEPEPLATEPDEQPDEADTEADAPDDAGVDAAVV